MVSWNTDDLNKINTEPIDYFAFNYFYIMTERVIKLSHSEKKDQLSNNYYFILID